MRKECIFTLKNSYRDDLNIIREDDLTSVKTDMPSIFSRHVELGEEVYRGEVLASITDPMTLNFREVLHGKNHKLYD